MEHKTKRQKGTYFGVGIAIGLPLGIPVGIALGNIAFGPLIGSFIGIILGYFLEKKYNEDAIEPSEEEMEKKRFISLILLGIGIIAFLALVTVYLV